MFFAIHFIASIPSNQYSGMFPATLDSASVHVTGQIVFVLSVNVHNLLHVLSSLIVNVNLARRNKGRTSHPQGGYWRARES